jgi:glucose/arabinose dehydrogenase
MALFASACSDDSPSSDISAVGSSQSTPTADTVAEQPADTTVAATGPTSSTAPADTTGVATTPTAPLGDPTTAFAEIGRFEKPVGVSWRPTDGTIYVVEQDGRIVIMADGQPGPVALGMTDLTSAENERGLLGLAIAVDGSTAYVNYTNNNGDTRIDEYTIEADGTFNPDSRREVLGFDQPYANHNGGDLAFGPDNMLYIGTGDGGSGGDPDRRALDLSEWLGKMLRIDPRPSADAGYTVPADNPYIGVDGARPEIWSIGLRNPWRYSFDRLTGDLWIADVGQGTWEEVDVGWAADGGGRGLNFGWSAWEGSHRFNDDQPADGVTQPIHEYEHGTEGCSISGGVRYRGTAIPALVGWYVYGDYCSSQVRALKVEGTTVTKELVIGEASSVSAVSEGPDGELYVVSLNGPIYAVSPG